MLSLQPRAEPFNLGPTVNGGSAWSIGVAWVCLIWYTAVILVCVVGYSQIWRYFLQRPRQSHAAASADAPHVTVIRPVKGLEPHLYECLASTFRQDYPADRLTVCFCISSRQDPGYPTLERLVADFSHAGARLYVEEEDPLLQPGNEHVYQLGPNPKIRNMSRAYREGEGDIVWIIDCNVWIGPGVCGRMVDRLCGFGRPSEKKKKYKFVHHLPLVVDVTNEAGVSGEREALLDTCRARGDAPTAVAGNTGVLAMGGGRLEELFMSSAHAKMYTAINTVLIAPCIVGKSNMFRRSHLDYLTAPASGDGSDGPPRNPGIDYFSDNICEDHLIGDLLWRKQVREEQAGEKLGKHAMVFGDLAFQPVANMSVPAYIARRVRWLRVRKFTVLLATLVEPGTESFLCSCYGAWGITTALAPWLQEKGYAWAASLTTWTAFSALFWANMLVWILVDWTLYIKLHSAKTVELSDDTPPFARPPPSGRTRRSFGAWLAAWLGRELLALPIWIWAVYGGVTVRWRDRQFRVGFDAKVREVDSGASGRKARRD